LQFKGKDKTYILF